MAVIKFLLTAKDLSQRNMGKTSFSHSRRTFSALSTSNIPITEVFFDESGMRRFFEIEFGVKGSSTEAIMESRKRTNWIRNKMPVIEMWREIDETLPKGYIDPESEVGRQFTEIQKQYKSHDTLDALLEIAKVEEIDNLPLLASDPKVSKILGLVGKDEPISKIAEKTGTVISSMTELHRDITSVWADGVMKQEARFVPRANKLFRSIKKKGWATFQHKGHRYVIRDGEDLQP